MGTTEGRARDPAWWPRGDAVVLIRLRQRPRAWCGERCARAVDTTSQVRGTSCFALALSCAALVGGERQVKAIGDHQRLVRESGDGDGLSLDVIQNRCGDFARRSGPAGWGCAE